MNCGRLEMKRLVALVVDDDPSKRSKLVACVRSAGADSMTIHEAQSVRSGRKAVRSLKPDFIVLDMSLPTFDISVDATGGRPQGFGGIELLRYIKSDGIQSRTVIVTAYEDFSHAGREVLLEQLEEEWRAEFSEGIIDVIFFSSILGGWEERLSAAVVMVTEGGGR